MDALPIARLQFATTTSLHFLFVLLTLGLVTLVAVLQTRSVFGNHPDTERLLRFWGRLYVINYALGIGTGIVMEFQFGLTWTGLSAFAGDVFGAPLALETLVAFFLESTFLGLWIFGFGQLNRWVHLTLIWLVTLTAYASATFVMAANSFLQNPVGSHLEGGALHLDDFGALFTNPALTAALPHVLGAAILTGGFFVTGVSAYHFLKHTTETEFFRRSARTGVVAALIGAVLVVNQGFAQFGELAMYQPHKLKDAGIGLPLTLMIALGFVMLVCALLGTALLFRDRLVRARLLHRLMVAAIPLPFAAAILGWLVRELGRQPWLIWGKLKTADAIADVPAGQVLFSFLAFTLLLAALAVADWVLLARVARRGPDPVGPEPAEAPVLSWA